MRYVGYVILVMGTLSALGGVLEGVGFEELREIASHESYWEFANSCFRASIGFFLAELVHQNIKRDGRRGWR
jgi:hypothetical protein